MSGEAKQWNFEWLGMLATAAEESFSFGTNYNSDSGLVQSKAVMLCFKKSLHYEGTHHVNQSLLWISEGILCVPFPC